MKLANDMVVKVSGPKVIVPVGLAGGAKSRLMVTEFGLAGCQWLDETLK